MQSLHDCECEITMLGFRVTIERAETSVTVQLADTLSNDELDRFFVSSTLWLVDVGPRALLEGRVDLDKLIKTNQQGLPSLLMTMSFFS